MACLSVTIDAVAPCTLAVTGNGVGVSVTPEPQTTVSAELSPRPVVSIDLIPAVRVAAVLIESVTVNVSEICAVGDGSITVLSSTDGPLRTCDGGYILLDPEQNN